MLQENMMKNSDGSRSGKKYFRAKNNQVYLIIFFFP